MNHQKDHLLKALSKGIRYDGRNLTELRKVLVEKNIAESAEGSCRVKFGDTEVLVGVKLSVEQPYPDTPDSGNLMVNVELRPMSNPEFEVGPPGSKAIEYARVIDRGIREAKAIDAKKLCITKAEKVWSVMIDVCSINDAGNILDASGLGTLVALKQTLFPKYEEGIIYYDQKTKIPLPILREPLPVTVYKIGEHFLVDPLPEEEKHADARLTVAVTKNNKLCALQKGGEAPLTIDDVQKMVSIALDKAKELQKYT